MTNTFDPQILIRLRKAQFWTQEDLSAASGVSVRTIQRIEREGGGSLESWKGLAAAFDVPVETFQFVYAKQSYSAAEKRRAIIDVSLGCAGGFFGCAVSWWSIMQIPWLCLRREGGPIRDHQLRCRAKLLSRFFQRWE